MQTALPWRSGSPADQLTIGIEEEFHAFDGDLERVVAGLARAYAPGRPTSALLRMA